MLSVKTLSIMPIDKQEARILSTSNIVRACLSPFALSAQQVLVRHEHVFQEDLRSRGRSHPELVKSLSDGYPRITFLYDKIGEALFPV